MAPPRRLGGGIRPPQVLSPHWPCRPKRSAEAAYSLPEVMIASVLLSSVVVASLQLTGSSIQGMNRSKLRNQVSSAMSERIEQIRLEGFRYLCSQGCQDNELTQELKFNLTALLPRCQAGDLGSSFLTHLRSLNPSPSNAFTVADANVEVTPTLNASGNQLQVTLDAPSVPLTMTTTLVPTAQGWCP